MHDLGDVGGVVADALDVLGDEQQVRAGGDVARVLHHVGQQLAEQAGVHLVHLLVPAPDLGGALHVALHEGVEHVLQGRLDQIRHARDRVERLDRRQLVQGEGALGDVDHVVADPLHIAGDLEARHDLSQVDGHGLAQGQQTDHALVDLGLQLVDLRVMADHLAGQFGVPLDQRGDGGGELRFRQPAHAHDVRVQLLELGVEGLDDVIAVILFAGHGRLSLRLIRRCDQPKRPVM